MSRSEHEPLLLNTNSSSSLLPSVDGPVTVEEGDEKESLTSLSDRASSCSFSAPRMVKGGEEAENNGDEDNSSDKKFIDTLRRGKLRKRGLVLHFVALLLWGGFVTIGLVLPSSGGTTTFLLPYRVHLSCLDVITADAVRCILVILALWVGGPPYEESLEEKGKNTATGEVILAVSGAGVTEEEKKMRETRKKKINRKNRLFLIGHYVNVLFLFLVSSKLWVLRQWHAPDGIPSACYNTGILFFSLLLIIAACIITYKIDAVDTPNKTSLRFKSMLTILKPYFYPRGTANKFYVTITYSMLVAGKAATIVSPIYLGKAVSKITQNPPEAPYTEIYIYCFLLFFPKLASEIEDVLYVKVWQAAFTEAAEITFRHLHSLSLDWHLRKKMGNALRSMDRGLSAADTLMSWLLMRVFPTIGSAFAAFLVFAFHFNRPEIAAVCFISLSLYMWMTYVITIWRKKFNEEMNEHDNDMHEKATDSLINFETVKYFSNEEFEAQRYVKSVRDYQRLTFSEQWATSVVNLAQSLAINGCMLFSLILAGYAVLHGEKGFSTGEFVAVQAYVLTIFSPLEFLGWAYTAMINASVDMQNLSDLLGEKADIVDTPDAKASKLLPLTTAAAAATSSTKDRSSSSSPSSQQQGNRKRNEQLVKEASVKFSNVRFRYPSQSEDQGLHDINFEVKAGTTTAIVGQTGSGKTTLSRLLFRFYDVLEGKIEIGGEDIHKLTQKSLRQVIGVVPQDTCMFNESIAYNLKYGNTNASHEEMVEAAKSARIYDFVENLTDKWESQVGERGLKLSGGEKQRVAIARCLLKNPPIVLLDEATSALDNKTEREVQKALQSLKGRTTLVIAHRLTTVRSADQIIVMKEGRIIERGTHDELMSSSSYPDSEYAAMWRAQNEESSGSHE